MQRFLSQISASSVIISSQRDFATSFVSVESWSESTWTYYLPKEKGLTQDAKTVVWRKKSKKKKLLIITNNNNNLGLAFSGLLIGSEIDSFSSFHTYICWPYHPFCQLALDFIQHILILLILLLSSTKHWKDCLHSMYVLAEN